MMPPLSLLWSAPDSRKVPTGDLEHAAMPKFAASEKVESSEKVWLWTIGLLRAELWWPLCPIEWSSRNKTIVIPLMMTMISIMLWRREIYFKISNLEIHQKLCCRIWNAENNIYSQISQVCTLSKLGPCKYQYVWVFFITPKPQN